jgi:hypothetical protein
MSGNITRFLNVSTDVSPTASILSPNRLKLYCGLYCRVILLLYIPFFSSSFSSYFAIPMILSTQAFEVYGGRDGQGADGGASILVVSLNFIFVLWFHKRLLCSPLPLKSM